MFSWRISRFQDFYFIFLVFYLRGAVFLADDHDWLKPGTDFMYIHFLNFLRFFAVFFDGTRVDSFGENLESIVGCRLKSSETERK